MIKTISLLMVISFCTLTCNLVEDLGLFRNEASNAHTDEYHLEDSLKHLNDDQWEFYDRIGQISTDGIYIKCDKGMQNQRKVVLFFGGQDMCLLSNVGVGKKFIQCGVDFLSIDFRGYGRSYEKFTPDENSFYEDGEAAIRFLVDTLEYTMNNIILSGFSLGTGVAVELATHHSVAALVLFAPYTSMDDMVETQTGGYNLPGKWYLNASFDNKSKIDKVHSPICFFSGTKDNTIPSSHTKELLRLANAPKEAYYLDDQDHNRFVIDSYALWKDYFTNLIIKYN
jgi:alpha-beta hydrolase superfamily lysophospholipase